MKIELFDRNLSSWSLIQVHHAAGAVGSFSPCASAGFWRLEILDRVPVCVLRQSERLSAKPATVWTSESLLITRRQLPFIVFSPVHLFAVLCAMALVEQRGDGQRAVAPRGKAWRSCRTSALPFPVVIF